MTRPSLDETGVCVVLDAGGGDHAPDVPLEAAVMALDADASLRVIGVVPEAGREAGDRWQRQAPDGRLTIEIVPRALESSDGARAALRSGSETTMGRAIERLVSGDAAACVSGGHSGALLALGVRGCGLLPGIDRPALMSALPHRGGETHVLDLGANLNVGGEQLAQFAIMGSVAAAASVGDRAPRVGLLNVGHEHTKGPREVQQADDLLRGGPLNYHGFIEGHDLFSGAVDVAVVGGFAGNLLLKASEGAASMLMGTLRDGLRASWRGRLGAMLAQPDLARALAPFEPSKHNGALLLGLNGVVVKSHGAADAVAMVHAIATAAEEAKRQVPDRIGEVMAEFRTHLETSERQH